MNLAAFSSETAPWLYGPAYYKKDPLLGCLMTGERVANIASTWVYM